MQGKMKAIVKKDLQPGIFLEEMPIPQIAEDEVLIQIHRAGICGSDVHMYQGASSYKVFEKFMPLIMGHEFSGRVVEVGKRVSLVREGDRVTSRVAASCGNCYYCRTERMHFCEEAFKNIIGLQKNGGFAEYIAVKEQSCLLLPDTISYDLGALIEPMGVTANAVNDSRLTMGETVVIQGPGPIGLLTLLFAKARGAGKTIMIGTEKDRVRLELAKRFDVDHIIIAEEQDPVQAVRDLTGGYGARLVFEASGVPQLVQQALDMCDKTGRVVVEGIYGASGQIELTPMVRSAKSLIGSYGGPIAWERIVQWLGENSYYAGKAIEVITHRTLLDQAEAAFERSVKKENIKELFVIAE